jgi:hypothetical protein
VYGSVLIFLAVVIGGLTSIPAAVSGAIITEAFVLFGPRLNPLLGPSITAILPLLLTGPLLVVNLYFYPGGSAESFFGYRDRFLRWVANKHDILVPSLVADRRENDDADDHADDDVILRAEQHVESVDTFDVHESATRP